MKKIIRILSLILVGISAFSMVSCRDKQTDSDSSSNQETIIKGSYIVKDRASEYKIVIEADADSNEILATEELNLFFDKAMSVQLPVITEESVTEDGKYVYIGTGNAKFLQDAQILPDYALLGEGGYILKTFNDDIYICGAKSRGTLYGVYEFLERTIDFDVYGPDVIGYQEDLQEIPLYNFNLIDVPDVSYRMNGYGFFGGQNDLSDDARRLRIDPSPIANIVGSWAHNTFEFFSAELFEQNPEWKGTDGEQLCYLARGNQEKYEDMQKHVLDQITSYLETDKDCIYIPFMQEDINSWCNCDECNKTISKYGGYATSTQIIFCNDLGDKLQVWIDKNQPGRDVKIIMFAYHKTTQAPAVKNAAGAFEPVHQDMRLRDNVGVFYAPITANYYYPLNHEENLSFYEIIQGWASVTDNCLWWLYSTNFYHYLFFFDNFGGMYETYKMMEDYNVELVFENTQYGQKAATAFHVLKAYLNAKLAWDGDQDYEALIDKWFKGYFKEAAPHMKKLFDSIRYRVAIVNAGGDYNIGDVFEGIGDNKEMWPYANLLQWENIINEAYDSIAGLRLENPAEYSAIHDRINLESVFVRYAQIVLYGDRYSSEVLAEMKKSFKADVMRLGVNQVAEDINLIGVVGNW